MSNLSHFVATFEGRSLATVTIDGSPRWLGPEVSLLCSDDAKYVAKMIAESPEFAAGDTHEVLTGRPLANLKALGLVRVFRTSSGNDVSEPIIHRFSNSAIVLREKGLWLVLQKTNADIGVRLRAFLAEHVLPRLARGEAVGHDFHPRLLTQREVATANALARVAHLAERYPETAKDAAPLTAWAVAVLKGQLPAEAPSPQRPLFKLVPA